MLSRQRMHREVRPHIRTYPNLKALKGRALARDEPPQGAVAV